MPILLGSPIGEFVERICWAWDSSPLECGQVGLRCAGGIDSDQPAAPASEELKIAGGFDDDHFGVGDVQAEMRVKNRMIDREAAVVEQRDAD